MQKELFEPRSWIKEEIVILTKQSDDFNFCNWYILA